MWKRAAVGVLAIAALAGGCSSGSGQSKSTDVNKADITACHDFGNQWIVHGAPTTLQGVVTLMDEMQQASNAKLRSDGAALEAAAKAQNGAKEATAAKRISKTCFYLGLVSKTGAPT